MVTDNVESQWERLLKIKTSGRDASFADKYKYPYEPTPYSVLERLANTGHIRKNDVLLDYGCGKGRVSFFMSYQTRCRSVGIEYDERIFSSALQNQKTAISGRRTSFVHCSAERYELPAEISRVFFFNPFSVEILNKVFARIMESYYAAPRDIRLFFYYPSDEFTSFMMMRDTVSFMEEIDCRDLFPGNEPREKIMVFQI